MTSTRTARTARRTIALVAASAAAALALSSCSSGSEPAPTTSATATTAVSTASASATAEVPVGAAALACAAYFKLDLLNSQYAGGAVAQGDLTEEEVKADFKAALKELNAQAQVAVADGSADQKLVINAKKMKKLVNSLGKKETLSDLSKAQKVKFAKQSLRVQKACMRAGLDLPADNVTARTAAGL